MYEVDFCVNISIGPEMEFCFKRERTPREKKKLTHC